MGRNQGGQAGGGGQSGQSGQATQNSQQTNQPNQQAGGQQTGGQPADGQQASGQPADGQQAQGRPAGPPPERRTVGARVAGWFTETIVRTIVALLGFLLLLFAIMQIFGVDVLSPVVGVLTSGIGLWLAVAFFALLLIVAAGKRWRTTRY